MILNLKHRGEKNTLNLYDSIKSLPVQIFFDILETNNQSLLNPKNQKVSIEKLNQIWESIREEYYKESNPVGYRDDLKKAKRINKLKLEIVGCTAGVTYYELTNEILPVFKEFGYTVNNASDVARVEQKMLGRKTKLTLLTPSQKEKDKKEVINFWGQVADLESALNRQLDIDKITVIRWINYIKQVRKQNEQRNNRKK